MMIGGMGMVTGAMGMMTGVMGMMICDRGMAIWGMCMGMVECTMTGMMGFIK